MDFGPAALLHCYSVRCSVQRMKLKPPASGREFVVLAYGVLDHIKAHPEQWDQTIWWCGTAGCFAGLTCVLSGEAIVMADDDNTWDGIGVGPDRIPIPDRAAQLLGFDNRYALDDYAYDAAGRGLFDAGNTELDLWDVVEAVFGPRSHTQGPPSACRACVENESANGHPLGGPR